MKYELYSYRNGREMAESHKDYGELFQSILSAVGGITEIQVADHFAQNYEHKQKSLSKAINDLLRERLIEAGWVAESRIFGEVGYSDDKRDKKWRLDFSKSLETQSRDEIDRQIDPKVGIALEVAFNNDGSTAWNLIKPVLSSELNHVKKEIQTGMGVIITVSEELKRAGGFDNTVGTFDDFKMHLRAMRNMLTVPMVIIGLGAPETYEIDVYLDSMGKKRGKLKLK